VEGIQLDVERYNNAVRNYNKYAEHLAKEYCIDIDDEMKKGHPPSSFSIFICLNMTTTDDENGNNRD
jgi:hypothetical protein